MVKHDLKCQFRMDDMTDNDACCNNDAENDGNKHRHGEKHESGVRCCHNIFVQAMLIHNRDSNGENCGKGSESDGCDKKQAPLAPGIQMATNNQPKGTSTVRSD